MSNKLVGIVFLVLLLSILIASCSYLPLLRLPGNGGVQASSKNIACGVATVIKGTNGVKLGAEIWAVALPVVGAVVDLCKTVEDGGKAMRIVVLRDKPQELKQLMALEPFQKFTAIGDVAGEGVQSTLFARSIRMPGKQ